MKPPIRIIIHIEGGLVQGVFTDCSSASIPIEAAIYDFDTEGASPHELIPLPEGVDVVGRLEPVIPHPERVKEVFDAFNLVDGDVEFPPEPKKSSEALRNALREILKGSEATGRWLSEETGDVCEADDPDAVWYPYTLEDVARLAREALE